MSMLSNNESETKETEVVAKSRKNSRRNTEKYDDGLIEKLVHVNRVAKVVKGGRRFSFSALVVVGDGKGRVGFGTGKAKEVSGAVIKATNYAKRNMVKIPLREGRTLHHDIIGHYGAGKVIMRSAQSGTGVIAGGAMRSVFEAVGIKDVVTKSIRSSNPYNLVRATFDGLLNTYSPKVIASRRGKKSSEINLRRNMQNKQKIDNNTSVE